MIPVAMGPAEVNPRKVRVFELTIAEASEVVQAMTLILISGTGIPDQNARVIESPRQCRPCHACADSCLQALVPVRFLTWTTGGLSGRPCAW